MKSIGGYHGLEIGDGTGHGSTVHNGALAVNLGRNALELIIRARGYRRVHAPKFICDVLRDPLERTGVEVLLFDLDERLLPAVPPAALDPQEGLLLANYFGLLDREVDRIAPQCPTLILDNVQAYFSDVPSGVDAFVSCRKYFGVADGAYLHGQGIAPELEQDVSTQRHQHLILRAEQGAEAGFAAYQAHEERLKDLLPLAMSSQTAEAMRGIDQERVRSVRERNRDHLHAALAAHNRFPLPPAVARGPMSYPFLSDDHDLRRRLHAGRIYTGTYWTGTLGRLEPGSPERAIAENTVHLPVDQRYDLADMQRIIDAVLR